MTTRLLPLALAVCAAAFGGGAAAQERAPGATVESLLEYARERNPEYASMRHEADAAGERVYPAGALPDPMLRMELQDIRNKERGGSVSLAPDRVGSTKYTLSQSIPFWGKRDLRREAAAADSDQVRGRVAATWAELSAKIKTAFAQHYQVVHNERLTNEIIDLVARIGRIAQIRYANGLVPQQDVIRAEVELTNMRAEAIAFETEKRQVRARLNALLARPSSAPLAEPERLRPLPPPQRVDFAALEERLRANNPQLFAEGARIRSAEKNRDLVYRNRYPDLTIGVSPIQMGSSIREWEVMFEVNIPLQQQTRRSQEREAEAMLSAARARREATSNQLLSELSENLAGFEAARRVEILTDTSLVPQAELTFQAALAGYETGKVDFATLLDAQRQIRKAKQEKLKAQFEAQMRLAEIERLLGEDL
ncbi:MAG: TolC family protein [Pseudomonadota bacterium]|jgi:outer membrane protein TolC